MKKILKLFLVFAVILGVIVGVQFIDTGRTRDDSTPQQESTFKRLGDEMYDEWNTQTSWDKELFDVWINQIDEKYRAGNITKKQYELLSTNLCNYAINKTELALLDQWSRYNCSRDFINSQYSGVDVICQLPYLTDDPRVNNLKRMKQNYDALFSFIDYTLEKTMLGANPVISKWGGTYTYTWKSFENSTATPIRNQYNSLISTQDYKEYFCKIDYIRLGLGKTESRIKSAGEAYYEKIVSKLKAAYNEEWNAIVVARDRDALEACTTGINQTAKAKKDSPLYMECKDNHPNQYKAFFDYSNIKSKAYYEQINQWDEEDEEARRREEEMKMRKDY